MTTASVNSRDDVVDVLVAQHHQIADLMTAVATTSGTDRQRRFADLDHLLYQHELSERIVVYPVVGDRTGNGGGSVAVACLTEGAHVTSLAADLHRLGTDHPVFAAKFALLRQAALAHAAHEERDEFPRLRLRVDVQKLHLMANHLRNLQTMDDLTPRSLGVDRCH